MLHWLYLLFAILFEVLGTTAMKLSEGFTKTMPSIAMVLFYILSLVMLTLTLKKIDVSIAYTIWSGLGTSLIAGIGIVVFGESLTPLKLASIALIILGVVGLQLSISH
ncbi:Ethidium bromide-methyl viologen resistance protein EmrE [hydrothermal vent metagenome]|uniref:Ethidium bromide-methyl viologen resistance protein EmrE n=1 Tax=hydrothermal vent metagenome TaxID=652676 RepID=A0A1W1E955_9ZZZZ